ncbi:unnamed protein product [Laminaria digitata]
MGVDCNVGCVERGKEHGEYLFYHGGQKSGQLTMLGGTQARLWKIYVSVRRRCNERRVGDIARGCVSPYIDLRAQEMRSKKAYDTAGTLRRRPCASVAASRTAGASRRVRWASASVTRTAESPLLLLLR